MGDINFCHQFTSRSVAAEPPVHSNMAPNTPAQHVCSQCNNVYNSPTYLAMHVKAKHEIKPDMKCNSCEFKTSSTQALKTHKKTNHDELSFRCDLCTFQTGRHDELKRHNFSNHLCVICGFKTESRQDLIKHQQNSHKLKCNECEFEVATREKLKKHVEIRHSGNRFDCNVCEFSSSNATGLLLHQTRKHADPVREPILLPSPSEVKHVCNHCKNVYNSMTYLNMHIQAVHAKARYNCRFCDLYTPSLQLLNEHKKNEHADDLKINCDMCEFKTTNRGDLERHRRAQHLCGKCEFITEKLEDLIEHKRNSHKIKCNLCNYEAKEVRSMKWHVGNKHEGKVYQCNKSDHAGSSWHLLKIHQRNKHEGVRFKCPKCDYIPRKATCKFTCRRFMTGLFMLAVSAFTKPAQKEA